MIGVILKTGILLFTALALLFAIVLSLLFVALITFVLVGILVAIYFVLVKKPWIENGGTWTLNRVKGKD